ncbi:MAG: acyltransferase [Deltaproteobacteria bacterium]|nr:acyltransferase [Deltaproteobacteria bacterium]
MRAIAVLAVVCFHAFPPLAQGGYAGVDVFFVISGYLISSLIFQETQNHRFRYADFYARRIRRIFPALILVFMACLVLGWFIMFKNEYQLLAKHVVAGAGFILNIVLWRETGYFDGAVAEKPLMHLWSLGIEEQFYIIWPLFIVFLFTRKNKQIILWSLLATLSLSFLLNVLFIKFRPAATFYLLPTRLWELCLGAVLAYLTLQGTGIQSLIRVFGSKGTTLNLYKIVPDAVSWLGLLLMMISFLMVGPGKAYPGWWALLPTLGACLLVSAGAGAWINRHILSRNVLVGIGLVSYPLYLWHWSLLSFAHIYFAGTPASAIRIAVVLASFLLACITYKLIERPLRSGRAGQVKAAVLCVLMVSVGCLGLNRYVNPVTNLSFDETAFTIDEPGHEKNRAECRSIYPFAQNSFCQMSNVSGTPSVALIGDSHAKALFGAIRYSLNRHNIDVVLFGRNGCPPFLGIERDHSPTCPESTSRIMEHVTNNPDIRYVILAGRFAATQSGVDFGGTEDSHYYRIRLMDNPGIRDRDKIFEIGLNNTLQQLTDAGKEIIIVLDYPELDFSPKRCVRNQASKSCFIDKKTVDTRQKAYRKIVAESIKRFPNVKTVDLVPYFCDDKTCFAKHHEDILYMNRGHLGANSKIFLGNRIQLPIP